jgi:HAD superfamily hydrolase (TIGR01509 family)
MVGAVIFDMDGLLIDSEPYWQMAQMEAFTALGVPLTPRIAREMVGFRISDHIDYWFNRYPWPTPSRQEVGRRITGRALGLIRDRGVALPGAPEAVRMLAAQGVPLAIASSSSAPVISAVLEQLRLTEYFRVVHSAEFEPQGKPHPGVYLAAARALGVPPEECVAIEDSVTGVVAAKAAKMTCLAVPAPAARYDCRFSIADDILPSLADLDADMLRRF